MTGYFKKYIQFGCVALLATSCQQDLFDPEFVNNNYFINEVPDNFDWATLQPTQINITPDDRFSGGFHYVVGVYDQNPLENTEAICYTQGICKEQTPFKTAIVLPAAMKKAFIRQVSPEGNIVVSEVNIEDGKILADFRPVKSTGSRSLSLQSVTRADGYGDFKFDFSNPAYDEVITSGTQSPVQLKKNKTYLIQGNYTGEIKFSPEGGEKLFVDGEWNVANQDISLAQYTQLLLLKGGKINFRQNSKITIHNKAVIAIQKDAVFNEQKHDLSMNCPNNNLFYNEGTAYLTSISDHSGSSIVNKPQGTLHIKEIQSYSLLNLNNEGDLFAERVKLTNGNFTNSGMAQINVLSFEQGQCENEGKLYADEINLSRVKFENNCYVKAKSVSIEQGETDFENETRFDCENMKCTGANIELDESAILEIKNELSFFNQQSKISGEEDDYSLIRAKTISMKEWKIVAFKKNIEIECSDIQKGNNGNNSYDTTPSVRWTEKSNLKIEVTDCNITGNGDTNPTPSDPDFPIITENKNPFTFVMEDNYPSFGDYDMNDLVVTVVSQKTVKEKNGLISEISYQIELSALGATRQTGFGLQIDHITPDAIKNITVTGGNADNRVFETGANNMESGQNKVVIPLIANCHALFGETTGNMVNTYPMMDKFDPKTVECIIHFNTPQKEEDLLITSMNFFCVSGELNKGKRQETHLPGFPHSNKTRVQPQVTEATSHLMWALILPGKFAYPTEGVNIRKAYPQFEEWVQSNKQSAQDWYLNPSNSDNNTISRK
ncbi:MAG: LruC domain-containing protein [Bacteroidales bacterium]